ncbi:pantoate--beta-alanine ligase [Halobacteriovorax marinus]|uniref:Pantothenate synthetase n=1 Tax=Halobacteriovorax marinus TaxID=97084 RepID=A0A1Y5FAM6_9BACT|nr:pantoate--beta-alanine ligase [Halobacteriovorax marinus]
MISLFNSVNEFTEYRNSLATDSIGLVPTMGNLHDGHLSLIKKSISENQYTIVTIFVNPLQFGPNEDFDKYPRTLTADVEKIKSLKIEGKEIIVLAPSSVNEIFPKNFKTTISVKDLTNTLCGASRPDHFDGVTTIVYRLFALAKASKSYFGQKDYQQVLVIRRMVEDLLIPTEVIALPINREESGLARSSRNQFLSESGRVEALELSGTILKISRLLKEKSFQEAGIEINDILEVVLRDQRWDYLEVLDAENLEAVNINTQQVVIAGALKIEETRLIDNHLTKISYAR